MYLVGTERFVFTCWPPASPMIMHIKTRVLGDVKRRKAVEAVEVVRRAYLCVTPNQTLPAQVCHQAQLQLNTFPRDTRPAIVKNRCTESGRGRGVMSEFGLCRVSSYICCSIPCAEVDERLSSNSAYRRWEANFPVCRRPVGRWQVNFHPKILIHLPTDVYLPAIRHRGRVAPISLYPIYTWSNYSQIHQDYIYTI